MNIYDVIYCWLIIGMLVVASRREMLHKIQHKAHRFTMLIICAMFGIVVNVGVAVVTGMANFVRFWIDTMNGEEPKE